MGAPQKADWREERRKRAWALKQRGWLQKDIAAALGVSAGAVSQCMRLETAHPAVTSAYSTFAAKAS